MMPIDNTKTIKINGLSFSYIEAGSGPLVLALHGFPELPTTFRHQISLLSKMGYRVIAPFMRGYAPTEAPEDASYESSALVQDVLALIDAFSQEPVILLGHDWGAQAAYGAAVIAPHKISKLVTIAVPPGMSQSFLTNPAQQRRSWYMFFFQMGFAEKAVAANDFQFLEDLWRDWSPGWDYPADEMQALKASFRQPGVLRAALHYYRHTLNASNHRPEFASIRTQLGKPIQQPALYIHGIADGCVGVEVTEGIEKFFTGLFQKELIRGGHFVHEENPVDVNRCIARFLER
jgi:pimeloyl-ACP methyl ester carboxylesterase